jgi:hypothetical protein
MKTLLLAALLSFVATPAFAANACQIVIAKSLMSSPLGEMLLIEGPEDIRLSTREVIESNSATFDAKELADALKQKELLFYSPGFHLHYVTKINASGACEFLATGQGD